MDHIKYGILVYPKWDGDGIKACVAQVIALAEQGYIEIRYESGRPEVTLVNKHNLDFAALNDSERSLLHRLFGEGQAAPQAVLTPYSHSKIAHDLYKQAGRQLEVEGFLKRRSWWGRIIIIALGILVEVLIWEVVTRVAGPDSGRYLVFPLGGVGLIFIIAMLFISRGWLQLPAKTAEHEQTLAELTRTTVQANGHYARLSEAIGAGSTARHWLGSTEPPPGWLTIIEPRGAPINTGLVAGDIVSHLETSFTFEPWDN